jgi:LacI family gluconate utilization system Gnt-I transcriptional repressor
MTASGGGVDRRAARRRGRNHRATLHDVARLARVSAITVSRALRAPAMVAPDTYKRVAAAVTRTGYVPDLVARSFKAQRSGVLAAIVPSISTAVHADVLQGVADQLRRHGGELMVGVSGLDPAHEEQIVRAFVGRRPDGMILTGALHTPGTRRLLRDARVPVVETWTLTRRPIDMNVGYSDERASAAMVRHLAALGYRRLGFLCGPVAGNDRARRRLRGFLAAARELGLPDDRVLTLDATDESAGGIGLRTLLGRHPDLDAVFCSSDIFAVGALFECQRRGWAVPQRLALAGFQGLPITAEVVPSLTTIEVPRYQIGREAAAMLVRRLDGAARGPTILDVGFRIVTRQST